MFIYFLRFLELYFICFLAGISGVGTFALSVADLSSCTQNTLGAHQLGFAHCSEREHGRFEFRPNYFSYIIQKILMSSIQ